MQRSSVATTDDISGRKNEVKKKMHGLGEFGLVPKSLPRDVRFVFFDFAKCRSLGTLD